MMSRGEPRVVKAPNPSPFTLDGTRTFLVGDGTVAVIDPGPDVDDHVRALSRALEGATQVSILLTHHHSDHAAGASSLASATGAQVLDSLREGDRVHTDKGSLQVVETPGHSSDHLVFLWEDTGALFVGDLLLGRGETTWLGEYPGCVADYLASLERVRELAPSVLYPTHGPPITRVAETLDRFRDHRLMRIRQVEEALERHPAAGPHELIEVVYGKRLHPRLDKAARASMEVILHHLKGESRGPVPL